MIEERMLNFVVYGVQSCRTLKIQASLGFAKVFSPMFQKHYFVKLFYHQSFILYGILCQHIMYCEILSYEVILY